MKGPILTLANSTVYPLYGHFCEKKQGSKFLKLEVASPKLLRKWIFIWSSLDFGTEPQFGTQPPPGCGSSRNELTSLAGDLPKAQAWRVSSLQLLLSRWWEDLGCRPLGLKPLKLMCLQLDLPVWQVWQEYPEKHRINPFNKDGLGATVFCCLGLNLEVHFFKISGAMLQFFFWSLDQAPCKTSCLMERDSSWCF